ncbi:MAG: biopolymer transporter ExbD [bacterium]|nr:biopolymer transporter ExbD [bacterium]
MKKNGSFLKKLKIASIGAAMADMALLLLVFFMATTTTEPPKGVEVHLPKAKTSGAEQDSLYISISKQGNLYFDGFITSPDELEDQLSMRKSELDRPVAITADKDLDYAVVRRVLDLLQEQEFLNVVFMSVPRKEDSKLKEESKLK